MPASISIVMTVLLVAAIAALVVWPHSRIFRKAGFSPW